MKKAIVCILALALVLAASLALADQKITLMLGNSQADSHPWNRAIEDMIRLADEYSDGRIEIINYPNATLGNENDPPPASFHLGDTAQCGGSHRQHLFSCEY